MRLSVPLVRRLAFATLLLAGSTAALADVVQQPAGKVSYLVPDGWKQVQKGTTLDIAEPGGEVTFHFELVPAKNLKAAVGLVGKAIKKMVKGLKAEKPVDFQLNGMPAMIIKGKGVLNNRPVGLALVAALTPAKVGLLVFGVATEAQFEAHKAEIKSVLEGIKPMP